MAPSAGSAPTRTSRRCGSTLTMARRRHSRWSSACHTSRGRQLPRVAGAGCAVSPDSGNSERITSLDLGDPGRTRRGSALSWFRPFLGSLAISSRTVLASTVESGQWSAWHAAHSRTVTRSSRTRLATRVRPSSDRASTFRASCNRFTCRFQELAPLFMSPWSPSRSAILARVDAGAHSAIRYERNAADPLACPACLVSWLCELRCVQPTQRSLATCLRGVEG